MDGLTKVSEKEYLPLRDTVYKSIRDGILSGRAAPGERLMETALAETLGVSRTPVREALHMLEQEGFVAITPRKGAIVKTVSLKEMKDVLEIRGSLEALAARLACKNTGSGELEALEEKKAAFEDAAAKMDTHAMTQKDEEFHRLLFSLANNNRLIQIINNLQEQITRYRVAYLKDEGYWADIIKEHGDILEALRQRNEEAAAAAALRHIQKQEEAVLHAVGRTLSE